MQLCCVEKQKLIRSWRWRQWEHQHVHSLATAWPSRNRSFPGVPWMEILTNLACLLSLKEGPSSWPRLLQCLGSEEAGEAGLSEHLPKQRGRKLSLAYRTGGEHPNAAGHGDVYPSHGGCSGWAPSPSDISRLHDDTRILRWCPCLWGDTGTKDSEREQLSLCLEVISHVTFSIWEEEIMLAQGQQTQPHEQHWYHLEKETLRKARRVEFHHLWLEAWMHPVNILGIRSWGFFLPPFSVPGLRGMPCGLWRYWPTGVNLRGRGHHSQLGEDTQLYSQASCIFDSKRTIQKEIFTMSQLRSAARHKNVSEESEQNSSHVATSCPSKNPSRLSA